MSEPITEQPASQVSLIVIDPNGHRTKVELQPLPFRVGRQADNHLILRDSRTSRSHMRIVLEEGRYTIEDLGSRFGTWVNGKRTTRQVLHNADRIDFGVPDSYRLIFAHGAAELNRLMEQFSVTEAPRAGVGAGLARLKAILEVARTLESGFSTDDVLCAVVDAALAITGAERGFLLLRQGDDLETRVARRRDGAALAASELRVPRRVIRRALEQRRDLFSMNFDPAVETGHGLENSIADLELRSVVCVPLVRMSSGISDATALLATINETVGLLYMDSKLGSADLAGGNREILQTLALEASTVLENARLLEEERAKRRMDEELALARTIQQALLPRHLPSEGWFQAAGSSVASYQVGGDYFDVVPVDGETWSAVVADVSGKGVGSALLASLLQGAFLAGSGRSDSSEERFARLNRLLMERAAGEKYATMFYCTLDREGRLEYVNAGHCPALLLRQDGTWEYLEATGMPVGIMEDACFETAERKLTAGDKLIVFSDGITEAQNPAGEFFGRKRLREIAGERAAFPCSAVHDAIRAGVQAFTGGAPQPDDATLLVAEYR